MLMWCHNRHTSVFIETASLEKLPSKAKDPGHKARLSRSDTSLVFQYHKDFIIIIIIITLLLYYYTIMILLSYYLLHFLLLLLYYYYYYYYLSLPFVGSL